MDTSLKCLALNGRDEAAVIELEFLLPRQDKIAPIEKDNCLINERCLKKRTEEERR